MNSASKRVENARAKQYIVEHPDCSYEELKKDLGIQNLSKPYFFNMRGILRKQGKLPEFSKSIGSRSKDKGKMKSDFNSGNSASKKIEILYSIDASALTQELRDHWKSHVLPFLQCIIPGGKNVRIVFLADPPILELRRDLQ